MRTVAVRQAHGQRQRASDADHDVVPVRRGQIVRVRGRRADGQLASAIGARRKALRSLRASTVCDWVWCTMFEFLAPSCTRIRASPGRGWR